MIYSKKQVSRFWFNVQIGEPRECWLWKRSKHSSGYGQVGLRVDGHDRVLKAHKVAWEIHNDKRLTLFERTAHTCNNKLCCNPHHVIVDSSPKLAANSSADNLGNAKLTVRQVQLIKYKLNDLTTREIADAMTVSYHTIWDIRKGITWRQI